MVTAYSAGFAFIIAAFAFLSILLWQATPTGLDPIIGGFFVGLLVKNIPLGLAIGATLELMSLGLWNYGGAIVPDYFVGALLGTAFAALTGGTQTSAVAVGLGVAVPVALFIPQVDAFFWSVATFFIHKADSYAEKHDDRGVGRMQLLGLMPWYIVRSLIVFFAIWLGATPIQHLITSVPAWLTNGLMTMATILPALGFGILLTYLPIQKWWAFFIVGFALFAYLHVPLLGVALIALACIIIYASLAQQGKDGGQSSDAAEIEATDSRDIIPSNVTRGDLVKAMWRHNFALEFSWNWERMQALGFCWAIMPVLRKVYPKDDDYYAAIKRHLAFYNCNPCIGSPTIFGAVCAMEEHHQPEMAESLKISLMGPFAGVGDTLQAVLWRPLLGVFAASLALQGNTVAVWIMAIGWTALVWYVRFPGFWLGYRQGLNLIKQISSGFVGRFTEYVGMAALVVMGAFVPSILSGVTTKVQFTKTVLMEGKQIAQTVKLQDTLDKILPFAIPVALTFLVYWLLRKKHWTNVRVLVLLIVLGILLGAFKIL
jgi:mannose/fructose/N-acetylgalactosamine-specific phosphotransferase system component IID